MQNVDDGVSDQLSGNFLILTNAGHSYSSSAMKAPLKQYDG
jgi:hypothetical protein